MRSFDSSPVLCHKWSIVTMRLSCTVIEIWRLKDDGVTTLIFWGHMTSSVTWPFDFRGSTSYALHWTDKNWKKHFRPALRWMVCLTLDCVGITPSSVIQIIHRNVVLKRFLFT